MPEMTFTSQWPDGRRLASYSPSLVVHDHLDAGQTYEVADFVARAETALRLASDRVQAKFGRPCSLAAASIASIHAVAAACPVGPVNVVSLTPPREGR